MPTKADIKLGFTLVIAIIVAGYALDKLAASSSIIADARRGYSG
ncbi:hypothetical protein [Parvibaculum sp.]|nr:hypothetical protein [Parvibaculum sp.]